MGKDEVRKLVAEVGGWLTDREGEFLYEHAKGCTGTGIVIEIGSWKGKSTIWLGRGAKAGKGVRVYAIDPYTGAYEHQRFDEVSTLEEFRRNIELAGISDIVVLMVMTSEEAAKDFAERAEFIFIDGDHGYESVKLYFELWFTKLIDDGVIALHDTLGWAGPKRVAKEFMFKSKVFKNAGFVDSIAFAQKVSQNTLRDRLRNRYILWLKVICEMANSLHLPKPFRTIGKRLTEAIQ